MSCTPWLLVPLCWIAFAQAPAQAAERFELVDGDHVVLLGNTLIEREQRYGYWEALLTLRYPHRRIQFRNLGWSGDTVWGDARAGFGSAADGFRQLKEHVLALQPSVIIIGYGLNESFAGEAGLPRFREGLRVLLDALAPSKARTVLLSPLSQEDLGRPLPDPAKHNQDLRRYRAALRAAAQERGLDFIDFDALLGDGAKSNPPAPLTDNGIHLTAFGYWRTGAALERGLGLTPLPWHYEIDLEGKPRSAEFKITAKALPLPPLPADAPRSASAGSDPSLLRVRGLAPGTYQLKIDGQPVALATQAEWNAGVHLMRGPEWDQVERLRQTIVEKNRLYFYRWRPQNETYLFGFRKHEQGQNAREIPQFDPLVAEREEEIARLRIPVTHKYELVRTDEKIR
ncbi:MAG TPA: SGNH/GDSL hydrolase family protein [Gemmataceae bacterium]|nr:SGNH/GDSL hydrolase family protein [Gemmataceae bacterium]